MGTTHSTQNFIGAYASDLVERADDANWSHTYFERQWALIAAGNPFGASMYLTHLIAAAIRAGNIRAVMTKWAVGDNPLLRSDVEYMDIENAWLTYERYCDEAMPICDGVVPIKKDRSRPLHVTVDLLPCAKVVPVKNPRAGDEVEE